MSDPAPADPDNPPRREPWRLVRRGLADAVSALTRAASPRPSPRREQPKPAESPTDPAAVPPPTPGSPSAEDPLDPAAWWRQISHRTTTPIAELVDGFDRIVIQPIPYSGLPRRAHTIFGADMLTWADLAGETIATMTARPKAGIATVRAILVAAQQATAPNQNASDDHPATAAGRLLDRLTPRERTLLAARTWALTPLTVAATATRLGVNTATVIRFQPRADAHLRDLLADPAHRALAAHAEALRARLGPLTREHTAVEALRTLGLDPSSDGGELLLYAAGPYRPREGWLVDTSTDGLATAHRAVDTILDRHGAPTTALLLLALHYSGIPESTAVDFLTELPGVRRFADTDQWVRWGPSTADRAAAALLVTGAPATMAVIATLIGEPGRELRVIRDALSKDDRFVRASRQTWALRRWGTRQYRGVAAEIGARIDAAGGAIATKTLLRDMTDAFPDIAASSVYTYLRALAFVLDGDTVRRRTAADGWPPVPALNTVRGAFGNGPDDIRIALPVTGELLRGSGQSLHPAVATALAISPGRRRAFTPATPDTAGTEVTIGWSLSSTSGPQAGSLRAPAATVGAHLGDTLVLGFHLPTATYTAARITPGDPPAQRLQTLLGTPVGDPVTALTRSLNCPDGELVALLERRGESDLLDTPQPLQHSAHHRNVRTQAQ